MIGAPTDIATLNVILNILTILLLAGTMGLLLTKGLMPWLLNKTGFHGSDPARAERDRQERVAIEAEIQRLRREQAADSMRAEHARVQAEKTRKQIQELRLQYLYREFGGVPSSDDTERFEEAMRDDDE